MNLSKSTQLAMPMQLLSSVMQVLYSFASFEGARAE